MQEDHPILVTAHKLAADLNGKVDQKIEGILEGLATRLNASKAQIKELQLSMDALRERDQEMREKITPYYRAKQELAELQQFGSTLALKIASTETEALLPRTVVEVFRAAVPAASPVAPDGRLALVLAGAGVLCGVSGLVLVRTRRT
jgi:uncharacterized protein involved in exopolysaccharide biosynthesis